MKNTCSFLTGLRSIGRLAARLGTKILAHLVSIATGALTSIHAPSKSADLAATAHALPWPSQTATPEAHLSRIAAVINALAARCKFAESCHARAALQIDAALYDIERLRADLEASIGLSLSVVGLMPAIDRAELQAIPSSGKWRPPAAPIMAARAAAARSAA